MPQVTLDIPQSKYAFFMELVKSFSFIKKVKVKEDKAKAGKEDEDDFIPRTKEEIKTDLIQAFQEAEEIIAGRKKGKPFKEFLDELQD